MLASKIICDDTYSNKSWCIVGQGMFALRQINQMEREMCSYLEWRQLNVDPTTLRDFQARVQLDFAGPGPYLPMVLPPHPSPHQSTGNNKNSSTGSSIPAFASRVPLSKDAHVIPSPSIRAYPSSLPIPLRPPTRPRRLPRLLSKDAPVIPSPSIRTYPSSLPIPQRLPTRPRRLLRTVVERRPRYSQSIDPNIPLIPPDTQRLPTRPRHLPRTIVERRPRYSQSIDLNIPLIPPDTPGASHSASTSSAS
jgi:hypothetical protein